ncbi:MAG TPA: hypothetical protein VMK82_10100 [Steroidobacteraceae bacterium]|nr:hypothetical protein [Steroidobacteraceae bacterium]
MNESSRLRALERPAAGAPFDFDEFERRRVQARHRGRLASWSATAAIGVLTLVPVVAVLTQPDPDAQVIRPGAANVRTAAEVLARPPALVDLDRFAMTSELEDHIALLDAQISAARLQSRAVEELRRMESTRAQLNDSLQQVAYAHALLDL